MTTAILIIWSAVLTVALIAHMIKDNMEFKKIKQLQDEVGQLKAGEAE